MTIPRQCLPLTFITVKSKDNDLENDGTMDELDGGTEVNHSGHKFETVDVNPSQQDLSFKPETIPRTKSSSTFLKLQHLIKRHSK